MNDYFKCLRMSRVFSILLMIGLAIGSIGVLIGWNTFGGIIIFIVMILNLFFLMKLNNKIDRLRLKNGI